MPFDTRRVGQYSQRVIVKVHLPVHDFQYRLSARGLGEPPMHGGRTGVDMDDADFLQCPFHLVQGAAFRQDVGYHLEVGQALVFQGSVVRLVFAIAGKVEESGGKTFLVDSFHHEFLLFYRHSHVPVLAPELDPVHPRGGE